MGYSGYLASRNSDILSIVISTDVQIYLPFASGYSRRKMCALATSSTCTIWILVRFTYWSLSPEKYRKILKNKYDRWLFNWLNAYGWITPFNFSRKLPGRNACSFCRRWAVPHPQCYKPRKNSQKHVRNAVWRYQFHHHIGSASTKQYHQGHENPDVLQQTWNFFIKSV